MARPRAFDEEIVLTAAMHAFRTHGYARASVSVLEEATGLRASSLYNAYGDKAGLFRRALDHYLASFVGPRLKVHAGPESTLEDLEGLFLTLLVPPYDDGQGCLVTNSAAEFGSAPSIATDGVRAGVTALRRHAEEVLARELGPSAAPTAAARLVLLYQGFLVLGRAGLLDDGHVAAIRAEFVELRERRSPNRPSTVEDENRRSPR
ncbi:TetR/AcrR family transcriptional regulator [Nocardioides caldifontis]|uniref:TetR/AcrR family transcriptional regulator n=1 Tax=Nocardioides caldifontis TaxID=2588938 RepID=UPI0011DFFB2E|nr:TetR/AcrR family transcriptional regulator [Nocardioides caldifontis]